jgi:ectoine hydroxylase
MANQREEIATSSSSSRSAVPGPRGADGRIASSDEGGGLPERACEPLGEEQRVSFERDGFLLLEDVFALEELEVIQASIVEATAERGERTVLESFSQVVRSVYGVHQHQRAFADLSRHPRVAGVAKQLLGADIYVYQSKLNTKWAFDGDIWPWHQDYVYWLEEDAMPQARALTAAVFLDDITELNGPMMFIPGSHRSGVLGFDTSAGRPPGYENAPGWIPSLTARMKYTLDKKGLEHLAREAGVVAPKAKAGSVLFFDCNVAHASPSNLSPFNRTLMLYTYNRVDNAPSESSLHRPEFLVSRDTRPIDSVSDDVFSPSARAHRGPS